VGERETRLDRGLILSGVKSKTMAATSKATVVNALTAQRITPYPRETKDLGKDIDLRAEVHSFTGHLHKIQVM
jgi:hypothetical protein